MIERYPILAPVIDWVLPTSSSEFDNTFAQYLSRNLKVQRQDRKIMESASIIASIFDKLKLVESNLDGWTGHSMKILKMDLQLLRTFFLFARKWSNHVSLNSSLSNLHELNMMLLNLRSSFSSVEKVVKLIGRELICLLSLRLEGQLSTRNLADKIYYFTQKTSSFKEEINFVYSLSDCLLQSSCSPVSVGEELVEFIDSLVENLVDLDKFDDVLRYNSKDIIELMDILKEKMSFLKTFIRLGVFRGVEHRQLEHFLIHCEAMAVNAAHLSSIRWFDRNDPQLLELMQRKISEQLRKINPVEPQVREMYSQVLIALKLQESSRSMITEAGKNMVGDFIDSLLGCLWELLDYNNSFMVSVKLYEGLMVLRNIIKKQPEKFSGLQERTQDLFGALVTDAGKVIFSLSMQEVEKCWAREMDLALKLLEKIKLIKAEVAQNYPAKPTFNFPTATNELGFIDLLVENLKQLATCEVNSNSFAQDRFQKFQNDLVFLRSFLKNIVGKSNRDEKLQALRNRIIDVAYKVEFVIDSSIFRDTSYSPLMLINNVAEEIQHVKVKALEIDDNEYVCEAQKDAQVSTQFPSKSTISTTNEVVVGFTDEAREITDQLTSGSEQLEFVFIVGMPGIGKTTLAHKVYHDPSILYHFHIHAWCYVSQVYCKKDLLLEILVCIVPKSSNKYSEMREDDLAEELYRRLKGNRYVIVLDDIWGIEAWNYLRMSFPNEANGSRILLTSRIHNLALEIKPTSKPLSLRQLTDDESWELLQKKLPDGEAYHPALYDLGMRIAKGCKGVPLTVVITAGILATLKQDGWEEIAERIGSKVVSGTEQCRNILELSFRHLPDYLKPCFLYFGAFLEDEEIPVRRLMRLWIAEGFVQKNELKSPEDMAEDYIMALIQRSLVMVAKRKSLGTVKSCRIHDLLHEFCLTKATEENFMQFVHDPNELLNFDEPYSLRRVCICRRNHFMNPRHICPQVRSLLVLSQGGGSYAALENLLFVFRLKLLRVLDLGKVVLGNKFPDEITVLVQLRYLDIVCYTSSIPPSIANLSNLETFRLKVYNSTVIVPDTIWNMQMLRHLYVRGSWIDLTLAEAKLECSSHLYNLHTFAAPRFHPGKRMEKMMRKFSNIRKLKCSVFTHSVEEDSDRVVVMDFLSQLESLKLILDRSHNISYHIDFLFPLNLKKLSLNTFSRSLISTIGELPNLEALKLYCRESWQEIWEMKEGEFPRLKFLKLEHLRVVKWVGSGEHFHCLQKLVLVLCKKLKELPSCLEYIPTLELIQVHRCPKFLSSLVRKIEEEQMNMGNEDLKIIIEQEEENRDTD